MPDVIFRKVKRDSLFPLRKVYFWLQQFHSSRPSKHESNRIKGISFYIETLFRDGGRTETPDFDSFTQLVPSPQRSLNWTDRLCLWTLAQLTQLNNFAYIIILNTLSSNDTRTRVANFLVWRHRRNQPTFFQFCLLFNTRRTYGFQNKSPTRRSKWFPKQPVNLIC